MLKDRIKTAREAAGLTQEQLGKKCKTSTAAIGLLETGATKSLRATTAVHLAKALNIRIEWLVFGHGRMREAAVMTAEAYALGSVFDELSPTAKSELLGYLRFVTSREADKPETISDILQSLLK